eukprot:RCo004974
MDLYHQFQAYEQNFLGKSWLDFAAAHSELPVFAVVLYLAFIFGGADLMKSRKPLKLKFLFGLWNLGLSIFSLIGLTRTVPVLYAAFQKHGLRYTCCENPVNWYVNGPVGLWTFVFIFSKFPELLDTVFLVLQKKPVIFLHWFHHTTVLLYCWHAFINRVGPGLWFAAMNYTVHSVMYFYYFMMVVGLKMAKPVAPLITMAQLLQMVVGCYITSASAYYHIQDPPSCHVDPANYRLGLGMYASYLVLFGVLFRNLYCVGGRSRGSKADADMKASKRLDQTLCGVELKGGDGAGFFHPPEETAKTK